MLVLLHRNAIIDMLGIIKVAETACIMLNCVHCWRMFRACYFRTIMAVWYRLHFLFLRLICCKDWTSNMYVYLFADSFMLNVLVLSAIRLNFLLFYYFLLHAKERWIVSIDFLVSRSNSECFCCRDFARVFTSFISNWFYIMREEPSRGLQSNTCTFRY